MPSPFPPFASLALHQGNSQNLQLIGVGTDGSLSLAAWQSHATGAWTVPGKNALAFQTGTFSAVALGNGNRDYLQVLGLGADQQIYLAAWQDDKGNWNRPPGSLISPLGGTGRHYRAVAAHRGGNGFLQVFGLGTDGSIYVVVWQDENGAWHPDGTRIVGPRKPYTAILPVIDGSGNLQLLALADGQVYQAAWQGRDGSWNNTIRGIGDPKHRYTALAAAVGDRHNLQVVGLGTDQKLYLAAWLDSEEKWQVRKRDDGRVGINNRPYTAVTAHTGADGDLQIICLGTDGKAYVAAWQDKGGSWHDPSHDFTGALGDPMLTYRAQVVASGLGNDRSHPGELELVGLGAGENDDGNPYLVARQTRDGRYHWGRPLGEGRSPLVNWGAATRSAPTDGCIAFGRCWVIEGSSVVSFDLISGHAGPHPYVFPDRFFPAKIRPYGDKLAVVAQEGGVCLIDPATGSVERKAVKLDHYWLAGVEGSVFSAGSIGVVRMAPDGSLIGPYSAGPGAIVAGYPAVANGLVYVPVFDKGSGGSISVLDAATLTLQQSIKVDGQPGSVFCDGARLCFATTSKSLYVYAVVSDVGSLTPVTPNGQPITLGATADALPILNGGLCYVALGGAVQAIDVATGASRRSFAPARNPGYIPIMNGSGVLFYSSAEGISMIDTAATSGTVVTYATEASLILVGYQDGALIYGDILGVAAVRLDEVIHQYYAETNLIRDFDFSKGVGATISAPNFQVEVALFDKDGSPRAMQPVRLTATGPTTVAYQGRRTRVSRTEFVDVETDGAGRLRVAVDAGAFDDDNTFHQGLTAPELLLTSPFMDARMRFVIRPHGQLQQQLATISKEQLKGAKGYDEEAVLTSEYRDDDDRLKAATGAINQTAGMVQASMANARKRDAGNMYCDPACDMAVACCMPASDPGCRVVCDQSFSFDLSAGQPHFRLLSVDEARDAAAVLIDRAALGDWDDFWNDVVTGVAKVTRVVIEAVAAGAKATIHFGAAFVEGVISTIEQATLLVQGVFNEIATAINRVVEAVSFLFDWGKIVDLHDQIRDQMTDAWTSLATGRDGISFASLKAALDSWFDNAADKVDQAFASAEAKLGMQTPLGAQTENSGKQNSAVGSAQDNWLLGKFQDNVLPESSGGLSVLRATTDFIAWPDIQLGQDIRTKFDALASQLEQSLSDKAKETIDSLREMLDFQSSPGILARGFAAVLEILHRATDMAIKLGKIVADFAVDLLQAVMTAIYEAMTKTIEIPYISDFYRWATKRDLSMMDLFALVTAIPTGFALGLLSREPAYASKVSPLPPGPQPRDRKSLTISTLGGMEIAAGCAQVIFGLLGGVLSALDMRQTLGTEVVEGSGPSRLSRIRCYLTFFVGLGTRIAFLVPLVYLFIHGPKPNVVGALLWAVPSFIWFVDCCYLWFAEANPDGSYVVAAFALGLGVIMPLLGGWEFYESTESVADGFGLGFTIAVGLSLVARSAVVLKWPQVKYGAITASALLLVCSGGFEVARGFLTE
jgi:hypothetical protein